MGLLDNLTNLADEAYIHAAVTMPRLSDMVVLAAQDNDSGQGGGDPSSAAGAICSPDLGIECLPVLRWAPYAGAMPSRSDGVGANFLTFGWVTNIQANLTGMFIGAGNGFWASAAGLNKYTNSDQALKSFGAMANGVAGRIYDVLFAPSTIGFFISIPVFITIVLGFFAAYGRQGWGVFLKRFAALVVGFSMFFAMGASSSAHPKDPYVGTPYWLAKTAADIVHTAGNGIVSQFNNDQTELGTYVASDKANLNQMSCRRYTLSLNKRADELNDRDAILSTVNLMWEETGLRVWMRSAFGTGENAANVFCRALEQRAKVPSGEMLLITKAGATPAAVSTLSKGGHGNGDAASAVAWNPTLTGLSTDGTDWWKFWESDEEKNKDAENNSQRTDRYLTMFDTCRLEADGTFTSRNGFKFLAAIQGKSRKDAGVEGGASGHAVEAACEAAFTTQYEGKDYDIVDAKGTVTSDDKKLKRIQNLVTLFDLNTRKYNWNEAIDAWGGEGSEAKENAKDTIDHQHGNSEGSDVTAAILFAFSGMVAMLLWGLFCGILKILSMAVACFIATGGIFLGSLVIAFAPEKGRRTVMNAFVQMFAWIAGPTVIIMFASVGCLYVNTCMTLLGLITDSGTNPGTGGLLTLVLATILLPISYILIVRHLCVNVWHFGDPFSLPGLAQLAGFGGAISAGLKTVAGAAIGAGMAAMTGGGSAAMMIAAGQGAAGANGKGGLAGAALGGAKTGYYDSHPNGWGGRGGQGGGENAGGHGPSAADRAAVEGGRMNGDADKRAPLPEGGGRPIESGADASASATPTARIEPDKAPGDDGAPSATPPSGSQADEAAGERVLHSGGYDGDGIARTLSYTRGELNHARRELLGGERRRLYEGGMRGRALRNELEFIGRTDDFQHKAEAMADRIHSDRRTMADRFAQGRDAAYGRNIRYAVAARETERLGASPDWIARAQSRMRSAGAAFAETGVGHAAADAGRIVSATAGAVAASRPGQFVGRNVDRGLTAAGSAVRRTASAARGFAVAHPNATAAVGAAAGMFIPGVGPVAGALGGRALAGMLDPNSPGRLAGSRIARRISDSGVGVGVREAAGNAAGMAGRLAGAAGAAADNRRARAMLDGGDAAERARVTTLAAPVAPAAPAARRSGIADAVIPATVRFDTAGAARTASAAAAAPAARPQRRRHTAAPAAPAAAVRQPDDPGFEAFQARQEAEARKAGRVPGTPEFRATTDNDLQWEAHEEEARRAAADRQRADAEKGARRMFDGE
ncbi:hypothetical protein [Bifidobacterium myosotis]|uniref:Uncharacterized protein n=1 Tax=Bifidobacterium myosotis TaxID=1630166 RepID=A0A5M9ZH60_9BIFI|nr:hypothetical protein [Bifidobacterium myosotis]KAA8826916.1 hypothetical protein EMO91_10310 [Bifidobacterium myosotis]